MWCGAVVCDGYIYKATPGDFGCRATGTTGVSACVGRWFSFGCSLGGRKRGKGGRSISQHPSLLCFALLCFAALLGFALLLIVVYRVVVHIEKYATCVFALVYCGLPAWQLFRVLHMCARAIKPLPRRRRGKGLPVFRSIQGGVWAWAYDVTPLQASLSPTRRRPQRGMRGHRVVESERAFAVHRFFFFCFFFFFFARIF